MRIFTLILIFSVYAGLAQAQHTLRFAIYPYHTELELQNLATDEVLVQAGEGAELVFDLPAGEYRYVASASGHCAVSGSLSVPENSNPSVFLNEAGLTGCSFIGAFTLGFGVPAFVLGLLGFLVLSPAGRLSRFLGGSSQRPRFLRSRKLLVTNLVLGLLALLGAYALFSANASPVFIGLALALTVASLARTLAKGIYLLSKRGVFKIWQSVAEQLEQKNGRVWRYRQAVDNVHIILASSERTEFSYLLALEQQKGSLSLEFDEGKRRLSTQPARLKRRLQALDSLLDRTRHDTLVSLKNLELSFVYLPNVRSEKFGRAKTNEYTFGLGDSFYVCESLDEFVHQIAAQERREQEQIERLEFGQHTETQAIAELRACLPPNWELETGVMLPASVGGNMDARLIIPGRRSVVLEIKSYSQSLKVGLNGVVKADGSAVDKDMRQVRRSARHYRARGVLWLPKANFAPFTLENISVFAGGAEKLYKYLGGKPKSDLP